MDALTSLLHQCINRLKPTLLADIDNSNKSWIKSKKHFWFGAITGTILAGVGAFFITDIIPSFPQQLIAFLYLAPLPGLIYNAYLHLNEYKERKITYEIACDINDNSPHWANALIEQYTNDTKLTDQEVHILVNTPLSEKNTIYLNHATARGFLTYQDLFAIYRQHEQEQHMINTQTSFMERIKGNNQTVHTKTKKFNSKSVL